MKHVDDNTMANDNRLRQQWQQLGQAIGTHADKMPLPGVPSRNTLRARLTNQATAMTVYIFLCAIVIPVITTRCFSTLCAILTAAYFLITGIVSLIYTMRLRTFNITQASTDEALRQTLAIMRLHRLSKTVGMVLAIPVLITIFFTLAHMSVYAVWGGVIGGVIGLTLGIAIDMHNRRNFKMLIEQLGGDNSVI